MTAANFPHSWGDYLDQNDLTGCHLEVLPNTVKSFVLMLSDVAQKGLTPLLISLTEESEKVQVDFILFTDP